MSKLNIITGMLIIMLVICCFISYTKWSKSPEVDKVMLLSGPRGGSYYKLAHEIKSAFADDFEIRVVETNGTVDNLNRMKEGKGDIALYQNLGWKGDRFELIAALHAELAFVIARKEITSLWQVPAGAKIYIGADNSGTQVRALEILKQYLLDTRIKRVTSLAYKDLKQAFLDNRLDIAFLVQEGGSTLVRDLLRSGRLHLLDIDLREGMSRRNPANHIDVIPVNMFAKGVPNHDIVTISNTAIMIARPDLPKEFIAGFIARLKEKGIITKRVIHTEEYDFPFHSVLLDSLLKRWPTSIHWQKIVNTKGWFTTTFVIALLVLLLLIFHRSVQESMDEFFFINGYRSRLREILEMYQGNEEPLNVLEEAQQLADEITRDVQTGIVEKSVQLVFIHHEILQLVAKLIKRKVIDLPQLGHPE